MFHLSYAMFILPTQSPNIENKLEKYMSGCAE